MSDQAEFRNLQAGIFCDFPMGVTPEADPAWPASATWCILTFLLTNVLLLPKEPLHPHPPASHSAPICTVQKRRVVGIEPELPQHCISPVLQLLASPTDSYSASH